MPRDEAKRVLWTKRVEAWAASGLSAEQFAEREGLKWRTLRWWKWQVAPTRKPAKKSFVVETPTPVPPPMTFVELPATIASESLEIVMPSAVRVRVPRGFDSATLVQLLDVLEARR